MDDFSDDDDSFMCMGGDSDDEDFGGLFEFDDDPSENLTKLCIARYVVQLSISF